MHNEHGKRMCEYGNINRRKFTVVKGCSDRLHDDIETYCGEEGIHGHENIRDAIRDFSRCWEDDEQDCFQEICMDQALGFMIDDQAQALMENDVEDGGGVKAS